MNTEFHATEVEPRYLMVKENIFDVLNHRELAVYMALRFSVKFSQDSASIKFSVADLCKKAKVKRTNTYLALNALEQLGLIKRNNEYSLGDVTHYLVAQTLGYFNPKPKQPEIEIPEETQSVQDLSGGIQNADRGVQNTDTYHYSLSLSKDITISDFEKSPATECFETKEKKTVTDEEIVTAYHETLPNCPKIRVVDKSLKNQLKQLRHNWPKYQQDGKQFTLDSFIRYLMAIQRTNPGFLKPYKTAQGNVRQNNLRTLTREVNIAKLLNGEFDFSQDRG